MTLQPGAPVDAKVNMAGSQSMGTESVPSTNPAPTTEQAVEEAPKQDTQGLDDERYRQSFLKLSKKERELQRQAQEIKQARLEWEQHKKELEEFRSLRENAKANPLALAKQLGLDYKQLTDQILNDERPTADMQIQHLQEKLQRLEDDKRLERQQIEEAKKQAELEAQRAEANQNIQAFRQELVAQLESQGEKYELIREFGVYDQILSQLYERWEENGQEMTPQQIQQAIEREADTLESQLEQEARKLLSLKKLSPKQAEAVAEALEAKDSASGQVRDPGQLRSAPPSKTLTNQMASNPPAPSGQNYLSEEESKRRAAALLRWK